MQRLGAVCGLLVVGVICASTARGEGLPKPTAADDAVLTKDGAVVGRYLDDAGQPVDGAVVRLTKGTEILAEAVTDASGVFELKNVQTGAYQIQTGNTTRPVRVWTSDVAPPTAQRTLTMSSSPVIRGQLTGLGGTGNFLLIGGLIGGMTVGIVEAVDANNAVESLQRQINMLNSP